MIPRSHVVLGVVAVVVLAGVSVVAVAAASGGFDGHDGSHMFGRTASSCTAPALTGTVVDVTLVNMGGPMMGHGASVVGGMMRLTADRSTIAAGPTSFLAVNGGSVAHELVILPLPDDQIVGTRPITGNGTVDESGALGEASKTCGAGAGDGIAPGASSWVAVTLTPGRYELICNLPGHYAAGMYTQLTVQ